MAVFQKIRDNSLLSLIVIGGGLFLFIIGDSFSSSAPSVDDSVGNFEGHDISQREYDNYFSTILYLNGNVTPKSSLSDQEKQQFSAQTWNQLVMKKIFESEGDKNGINVTDTEVDEMLAGENPYPFYVGRLFGGAQNFQNVRQKLSNDVENFQDYAQVGAQQAEIIKSFGISLRKQEKLMNLVKNSFFTTSSESLDLYQGKYGKKSVELGTVPYYLVPDSVIEVSEKEIKDFYDKNKGKYKLLNPNKQVIYGSFNVDPSSEDDKQVQDWAKETVKLFAEESNDELFVRTESESSFDKEYYKQGGGLVSKLDNALFDKEAGFVFGPYNGYSEGNKTYNVAKITDVQYMPDSAKVSQVLLTPEKKIEALLQISQKPAQEDVNAMWESFNEYADSVYQALVDGADFSSVASAFSVDSASASKGGDLGWIQEKSNLYAPQFLDSVFFESESQSKIKKVQIFTQNGGYYYYQLVKVDEMGEKSKKIQVGVVSKSVLPGNKTRDGYFNKINQVAIAVNEGSTLFALKDSFQIRIDSSKLEPQQYLVNDLKGARSLVNWAFNEAVEEEAKVFDFDRKYVIAILGNQTEAGYRTLKEEQVKNEIREKVKKIKKASYIAEKIGEVNETSFDKLAELFSGASLDTAFDVLPGSGIPALGFESSLTGVIASLAPGSISAVVTGLDAAYIVKVNSGQDAQITEETNFELESNQLKQKNSNKVEYVLQELITEKADLEDRRNTLQ